MRKDNDDESAMRKGHDDDSAMRKDHDDDSAMRKGHDDDSAMRKGHDDDSAMRKDHDDDSAMRKDHDDDSAMRKDHDDDSAMRKDHDDDSSQPDAVSSKPPQTAPPPPEDRVGREGAGGEAPAGAAEDAAPEIAQVKRIRSAPRAVVGGLLLLVSLITMYVMRDGWRYWLQEGAPRDLGRAEAAVTGGDLRHNTYVKLSARPIHPSEGRLTTLDPPPGCVTGPERTLYYTLLAETGDRLVLRTDRSLREAQKIPERVTIKGRLLRLGTLPDIHRMYKRFLYRLTDCRRRPRDCDRTLLVGADIPRENLLPLLGKAKAVAHGEAGHRIEVYPQTPLFLLFRYENQWDYRLSKLTKAEALARVKALGLPWAYTESEGDDHHFVIRAPAKVAKRLIDAQRRGKAYSISQRTASYLTTLGRLSREGDELVIKRVGPGFPEDYVIPPSRAKNEAPRMKAIERVDTVRVPLRRVVKASYHGPRQLPDSAWLLVEDLAPREAWPAALVAGLATLMGLFGLVLLVLGLRRPRA
jgi:hypothetical protein